jgi:hypothetical protein
MWKKLVLGIGLIVLVVCAPGVPAQAGFTARFHAEGRFVHPHSVFIRPPIFVRPPVVVSPRIVVNPPIGFSPPVIVHRPIWVPGQWYWTSWGWRWVPGYWIN